jgi:hypothetical protein
MKDTVDKVLCKWFTAMHSKRKPVTGLQTAEKAKCVRDEITDMCSFSDGGNKK